MESEITDQQARQYIAQGDEFFGRGDYDQAIVEYTTAIKLDPGQITAYWSRGRVYYIENKYSAAIDDFSKAIDRDLTYIDAYYYRGWAYVANNGFDKAISDFSKVIELDKGFVRSYSARAWCYANKAQWDESSQLFLYQLFESDAGLTEAYKGDGWVYVRKMQWELSSVPDLIKTPEQVPVMSEIYINRGFAHLKKAQWALAIADMEKAYKRDPSLNRGSWNKDWALGKREQWGKVCDEYGFVLQIIAGVPISGSSSGELDEELKLAIADYKKAVELAEEPDLQQKAKESLKFIDEWLKAHSILMP